MRHHSDILGFLCQSSLAKTKRLGLARLHYRVEFLYGRAASEEFRLRLPKSDFSLLAGFGMFEDAVKSHGTTVAVEVAMNVHLGVSALNAYASYRFPALRLLMNGSKKHKLVHTVREAAEILITEWPHDDGEDYLCAVVSCLEALHKTVPAQAVRDALVRAADEARIPHMSLVRNEYAGFCCAPVEAWRPPRIAEVEFNFASPRGKSPQPREFP